MKKKLFFEYFFQCARETITSIDFNLLNNIVIELKKLKEKW